MSGTIETLRCMADQIAHNLEAMGPDKAVLATADHIDKFWDPRMKAAIFADDRCCSARSPPRRSTTWRPAPTPNRRPARPSSTRGRRGRPSDAG